MVGAIQDMARRLLALLPRNWFADVPPILNAVLAGFGAAMAAVYELIQFVVQQSRIRTAVGMFLDSASDDFFGVALSRMPGEGDPAFRVRICHELLRGRATRAAVTLGLTQLTGRLPVVFEPARSTDTGGYSVGGAGYGQAGGWGNLSLPYQVFLTIYRPRGGGIAYIAGYGEGGIPVYGSLSMETTGISDAQIYAAVPPLLPAGTVAWCRLAS
jgi:hypothetical protein